MMDNEYEVPPLRVIRVRSNGKRDFDPRDKRQLVEACLRPGVSVSGMALKVGINTNQLRKWIQLHQVANEAAAAAESALPAFVPVVEVSRVTRVPESPVVRERLPAQAPARTQPSQRPSLVPALLRARLPNGATVELECGGQDIALVKAMIEALGAR
jgi:transposase